MEQVEKTVKKAIRGNVEAYGQLIEMHKTYLYSTAMIYTKNEQESLDAVSECVLKGFKNIKKLKNPKQFKSWITRILINVIYDSFKDNTTTIDINEIDLPEKEKGITKEEKMDLYTAVDLLPDKYKSIIILKYFSEMKLSEIAAIMNMPEGTVSVYLTRAKKELRNYLKEDFYE